MTSRETEPLENLTNEKKMKNIFNLLLVISQALCLLILPAQSKASTDNPVGTIEGTAGVSLTGSATYQIPIQIPQGEYSFAPSLQINYSSQSGDGIIGKGWTLSGISIINRCGKSHYYDDTAEEIKVSSSDNIALDGKRLLLVSGTNFSEGAVYFLENDPTTKIVCHDSAYQKGFTVYLKDGCTRDYYPYLNSSNAPLVWLLSKETDSRGRTITYSYDVYPETNEYYLTRINYDTNRCIMLSYGSILDKPFIYPRYLAGHCIKQTKLLKEISTFVQNNLYNRYKLEYERDFSCWNLISITKYGTDDTHYNATHFSYGGGRALNEQDVELPASKNEQCIFYADVNGDGRMDIITTPLKHNYKMNINDSAYVYLSISTPRNLCFKKIGSIPLRTQDMSFRNLYTADVDGDGVYEICTIVGPNVHYFYIIENNVIKEKYHVSLPMPPYIFDDFHGDGLVGDYNGDGQAEYLIACKKQVYNSRGEPVASAPDIDWNDCYTKKSYIPSTKCLIDLNGNGKEDLIIIGRDRLSVYELCGNVISEVTSFSTNQITNEDIIAFGDFNGDGYTDILAQRKKSENYEARLYFSTGTSLVFDKQFPVKAPVRVGDVNKDGKSDYLYKYIENGVVYLGIGISGGDVFWTRSFQSDILKPSDFDNCSYIDLLYTFADFDGDGRCEFALLRDPSHAKIVSISDISQLLLTDVTDGMGKSHRFSYNSSSDTTTCNIQSSDYGNKISRLPRPIDLVSQLEVTDGTSNSKYNYGYTSPQIHTLGKGFLGFKKISVIDETRQTMVVSDYAINNSFYYPNLSTKVTTTLYGDSIIKESYVTSFGNSATKHAKAYVPYVERKMITDYLQGNTTTQLSIIDNYGQPRKVITSYGDELYDSITTTYHHSTSPWIIGQIRSLTKTIANSHGKWTDEQEYEYDEKNRPTRVMTFAGNEKKQVTDEELSYDAYGCVKSRSLKTYSSDKALVTNYAYTDDHLHLSSETDPLGLSTNYEYDLRGQLQCIKASSGLVTEYTYDAMGCIESTTGNDSVSTAVICQWDNSVTGSVFRKTTTMSDGATTKVWYDAFGREVRNSNVRFDGTELKTDRVYNKKGQLWKVSMPYKNGIPTQWDIYTYNSDGTLSSIDYASGKKVEYSYDKRNTTIKTDGIAVTKTVNARGELIKVSDPKGDITYALLPDGQPQTVEALGVKTSFEYDSYGRRTAINDPSAGLRRFEYNENGQLSAETDADGRTVSYTYDNYGRVTDICRAEVATHYEYDNKNRLASVSSDNGTGEQFSYDNYGRLSATTTRLPDNKYLKREYAYQKGNVSAVKYTNQSLMLGTETFIYANGCLKNISFNSRPVWQIEEENDWGQCIADISGPVRRIYSFDDSGLPTGRKMLKSNEQLMNFSYGFNSTTGNLSWRKDVIRDKTEAFAYDDMNRLTSYSGNTMAYDDKGNILSKSDADLTLGYNHSTKPYAVTSISPGFSLSAVRYSQQYISYNSFECPDTISDNGLTCSFVYNADGERVMMKSHSHRLPTRYYVENIYEEEYLNDTTTYRLYLGGDAYSAPAVYVWKGNSGILYYIGRDHLGSITHITDNTGNLLHEYSYDPWGRLRNLATQQVYNVNMEPRLFLGRGYCGHEHLDWCGLINMNARLYDPVIGRFLNSDPYVQAPDFSQNFNRYSYCLNNPLKYTDPSGEWALLDDGLAMLVGGVINLGSNLLQGNVHSFWQGASLFAIGAASGEAALYSGPAAPFVAAAITSVGNDIVNQSFNTGGVNWEQTGNNLIMSEMMAGFTFGMSGALNGPISGFVSNMGIRSPAVNSMMSQSLVSGTVGATIDGGFTLLNGGSGEDVLNAALRGGGVGLTSGAAFGLTSGIRASRSNGINPWTGKISAYKKGLVGVQKAQNEFVNSGGEILGNEITVEVDVIRNRFDFVGSKDGIIYLYEVKNGIHAQMTTNQKINISKLQNHRSLFIPVGNNAAKIKIFKPFVTSKTPYMGDFRVVYRQYY